MRITIFTLLILSTFISTSALAQKNTTTEDSLNNGQAKAGSTTIGGYGNAFYQHSSATKTSKIDLERFVLFTGHKFNDKISFFSELEVEDAKVSGGEEGGEVAFEQAYLKFNLN